MKKTLEQFKEELNTKDKEIIAIERREGNRVFLRVKCKKCGEEKIKNPQQIKLYGCRKCEGANITSRQRQTLEQIKRILVKLCKKKEINYKPKAIKKKVFRYDLFGNLLGVYCSVRNAAIEANNTEQGVSLCCRNKNKTSKKEIFSFEELTKKQIEERLQND